VGVSVWVAVLVAAAGCYAIKLAGLSVPPGLLERPVTERIADLLPTVLLSALVAVQVLGSGQALVLDARVVGLGVAVVALVLRAPFLAVVAAAALAAAAVRLAG
jgi:Branched-chain amino acid transport protein (AzlD)